MAREIDDEAMPAAIFVFGGGHEEAFLPLVALAAGEDLDEAGFVFREDRRGDDEVGCVLGVTGRARSGGR